MDTQEYQRQMINVIGVLAVEAYEAEVKRQNTKDVRGEVRRKNLCTNEGYDFISDKMDVSPCWISRLPKDKWCDECKTVQPFYEVYIKAARECGVAKNKLTVAIKKYLMCKNQNEK